MTHEEVRALLPAYAAGALEEGACELVRTHLASGCVECLNDVFARPVGLFRPAREVRMTEPPPPAAPTVPATARRPGLMAAVVVLSLALAATVAWMVIELRDREAAYRERAIDLEARLVDVDAARVRLESRLAGVERQVAAAQEEAGRQAEAARAAAEETARVRDELEAAREQVAQLTRDLQHRESARAHRNRSVDAQPAVQALLATPGTELLPLWPAPPFRDVRGHVLWNAASDVVFVYAFGLPPLPAGGSYRIRLGLEDGHEAAARPLTPDARGAAAVVVALDGTAATLRDIKVVIEPGGQPVLVWRRTG